MQGRSFRLANMDGAGASPLVLSVPHAGRDYPPALLAQARLPLMVLRQLEDAYVDRLAERAIAQGFACIVAERARAWIDLNRAADDVDPALLADPHAATGMIAPTGRSEHGLGLFPRLLPGHGGLWRGRFAWAQLQARIAADYHPYHAALAAALAARKTAHDAAILIDLHSMPPPQQGGRAMAVDIVFGTLNGRSCAPWLVAALEGAAQSAGYRTQRDVPYAGGHIAALHGRPDSGSHAVQVEINRALYLRPGLVPDAHGIARLQALVVALAQAAEAAWRQQNGGGTGRPDAGVAWPLAAE